MHTPPANGEPPRRPPCAVVVVVAVAAAVRLRNGSEKWEGSGPVEKNRTAWELFPSGFAHV